MDLQEQLCGGLYEVFSTTKFIDLKNKPMRVKKECPTCQGSGESDLSNCCGAKFDSDIMICSDCLEHISEDDLECDECFGNGFIMEDELTEDDYIQDKKSDEKTN